MSTVGEGYFGEPGHGKTTLAQLRMIDRAGERGVPTIMWDKEKNLRYPGALEIRERPPEDLIGPVWDEGQHVIYTPPQDPVCVERFFRIVCRGGDVCLLVDEASNVAKGEKASPELIHLCQVRRAQGVDLFFTSVQPQHLHADVWGVITYVAAFKTESAFALDRLKRERNLTDAQVQAIRALQPHQYIEC